MVIIYMLVVIEFKNFIFPSIIMAPIPLTLVGIIPGHWLFGAEFTATSMIGWIALAGIIVRNSILLVDFTKHEVERGVHVTDAVINSCQARTRPIVITALALVGGSSVILTDPIFEGMAISLLFGVVVSTALTLFVIPLGCISAQKAFPNCDTACADDIDETPAVEEYKAPLWMRIYGGVVGFVGWIVVIVSMVFNLLRMLLGMLLPKSEPPASEPPTPPPATPASTPPLSPAPAPVDNAEPEPEPEPEPAKVEVKKAPAVAKPAVTKSAAEKSTAVKKTAVKKTAVKKAVVNKAPVKKAPVKKAIAKKVAKKKASIKAAPAKKIAVKKAPSKKSSPSGRRGIRLKDDGDS